MNAYADKVCPYCKTAFLPEDEIVLCSACDMPHHKDCWVENQGCTTFGCTGTIKAVDGGISSVTATQMQYEEPAAGHVFCGRCGRKNESTGSFCAGCGAALYPSAVPPVYPSASAQAPSFEPRSPETLDTDILLLVENNWEYYQPKFADMKAWGTKTSWNWAAFLLAPYWLIYRKMYAYGAIALGAAFVLSLFGSGLPAVLLLGGYIAMGIFGNGIYLRHLEAKLNVANGMAEPYRSQELASGGVNLLAAILTAVGYGFLTLMFM